MGEWTERILLIGISAIISGHIGFFLNSLVRGIERRNEEHASRVDDVCALIDKISEKARQYWSRDAQERLYELENEIVALDHRLGALLTLLIAIDSKYLIVALLKHNEFSEVVTGGAFQEAGRAKDLERARLAGVEATAFLLEVRRVRQGVLRRWFQ
jgi:hypothetical protein